MRKYAGKWLVVFVAIALGIALNTPLTLAATVACDVDGDSDVDRDDVGAIFAARGTAADPGDPRDADEDQHLCCT